MNTVNWKKAPKWANYHATDLDSRSFWFAQEPVALTSYWYSAGASATANRVKSSELKRCAEWRNSLVKRNVA